MAYAYDNDEDYYEEPDVQEQPEPEPYVPPEPEPEPEQQAEAPKRVLYEEPSDEPPPEEPDVKLPGQYAQATATGTMTDASPEQPEPRPEPKRRLYYEEPDEPIQDRVSDKTLSGLVTEDPNEKKRVLYEESESPLASFGRTFAHGVVPAVTGAVGGALTGAAAGAAGLNPITVIGGALVGAGIGGYLGATAQGEVLKAVGHDDAAQRAANARDNPWSSAAGTGASNIAGGAAGIGKAAITTGARVLGGGIGAAWETGAAIYQGKSVKEALPDIAASTVGGAVFAGKRPWTQWGETQGAKVGARFAPAPPPAPPVQPAAPPPDQGQLALGDQHAPPYLPKAGGPQEAQIGGGEAQPSLPLDQPAPPPGRPGVSRQPELALEPPPTVDAQGQYGMSLNAPHHASRHSPDSMPAGAGSAREMPPPRETQWPEVPEGARPREPNANPPGREGPHSVVREGMAQEAQGVTPRTAAGIHVLQPGQMDPTIQRGLAASTDQPAPKPRTTFEPPRPPEQGPPAPPSGEPIPRNRSLAPLPPKYTQGVTEPPVPGGHTRMYQGERQPPNVFTTDRATAAKYGAVKSVDVSDKQGMPFFTPGRDAGTFTTRNNIYRTRARPVQEIATEPPTRGGAPAGGERLPQGTRQTAPPDLEKRLTAEVGLDAQLANRLLNQPAILNQEAARRGITPAALKAQAQAAVAQRGVQTPAKGVQTPAASTGPREMTWRVKGEDRTVRVSPIPSKPGYTRITYKGKDQAVPNSQLHEKPAKAPLPAPEPGSHAVNAGKEVTLMRDTDGSLIKGRIVHETTFKDALEQIGHREGLLAPATDVVRKAVMKMIGNMPVYVVPKRELAKFGQGDAVAYYNRQQNHIVINEAYMGNKDALTHAVLHEGIHGVTAHALHQNAPLRRLVNLVMRDVLRSELQHLGRTGQTHMRPETKYGFSGNKPLDLQNLNEREFIAEAFSNPKFQAMLKEHTLSPETTAMMQAYFGKHPVKTAWDALVQSVRKLLNIPPDKMNALEAAMLTTDRAIATNESLKAKYMQAQGVKHKDTGSEIDAMYGLVDEAPVKGKVIARTKSGNEASFTGETVHAAAAFAKAAGYKPDQIFTADGSPYSPPKAATPPVAAQAAPAAATSSPGGGRTPPSGSPPAGGTPQAAGVPAASVAAAEKSILSHVAQKPPWYSTLPTTKEEAKAKWREFYSAAKNAMDPIEQARKLDSRELTPEEDFAMLARLTKGLGGRFQQMIKNGTYDINTGKVNGKGLDEIIKPVENNPEGFTAYALSKRVIELEGRGIKTGMNVAEARQVVAARTAEFEPVFRDLVGFQSRVLDNLVKTGVISHEAAAKMRQLNKEYVPFYRMLDPKSELGQQLGAGLQTRNPIFKIKGSDADVFDPIDSIIKNTYVFTDLAHRNQALVAMKEFNNNLPDAKQFMKRDRSTHPIEVTEPELQKWMDKHGIEGFADDTMTIFRPNAFTPENGKIRLYNNGRAEIYNVPPEIGKAVNAMDMESQQLWLKIASTPAKMLRTGAVLSPEFMLRNPLRDMLTAFIQAKHGSVPVVDFAIGLKEIFKKGNDYQEWLISGGANANLVSMDRSLLKANAMDMKGVANKVVNPKQWYKMLQDLSELSENATRVGMYKRARGKGVHQLEAAFEAREGTLDFSRMGSSGAIRALNSMVPFLNVHLEGLDRAARAFRDKPLDTTAKIAASITAPSVLLWMRNKDDERVQQLPAWQRDLFWIVTTDKWEPISTQGRNQLLDNMAKRIEGLDKSKLKNTFRQTADGKWEVNNGTIYRIPKPFELGVIFGSIPERLLDAYYKEDPKAFKNLDKTMMRALIPNYVPQAALPAIEQFANRSLFLDRTLLTAEQEKLPTAQQFGPHTSETAKALGGIVRGIVGDKSSFGSPVIIDNYIRQWTGGLGKHVTDIVDAGIKSQKDMPPEPTKSPADWPGYKAFVARFPDRGAQSIQDFYDQRNDRKREQAGIKALQKTDPKGASEKMRSSSPYTGDPFAAVLKADRDAVTRITNDKTMSPDDKRAAIDLTYLLMIEHAKKGVELMERTKRK